MEYGLLWAGLDAGSVAYAYIRIKREISAQYVPFRGVAPSAGKRTALEKTTALMPGPSSKELAFISFISGIREAVSLLQACRLKWNPWARISRNPGLQESFSKSAC